MPVTDATIETAVTRLAVHYKGSFPSAKDLGATGLEYARCLERMPWCDDATFLLAVDYVIDHEETRGFLPEWSVIRKRCWALTRKAEEHSQAEQAIQDIRRRSALGTGSDRGGNIVPFFEDVILHLRGPNREREHESEGPADPQG